MAAGTPRAKGKGFWDGGSAGHGTNKESSGRSSGLPGLRKKDRVGVTTDLDSSPAEATKNKTKD